MRALLRQAILDWSRRGGEPAPARLAQADGGQDGGGGGARARRRRRARARARAAAGAPQIRLTPDAIHVLEGDREHALGDVVFEVAADYPSARIGLDIGARARIDVLRIRVLPGVTDVDRFVRIGDGVRIGLIDVAAADQTDPIDEKQDGFVQIRGNDVRIDAMRFVNIDRCALVQGAERVWIGSFDCTGYARGLKLDGAADVYVGALTARRASPYALPHPGYNGLTIEDSTRVHLPQVEVEDAAEHAVYLAGGAGAAHSSDIRFGSVVTRRSGQCGFKCKATLTPSVDVAVDRLTVIDAAWRSRPGPNEDGLRVENCRGFHVGSLQVRRAQGRHSCYAGLYLDGVTDFALSGGHVEGTAGPMVLIEDGRGGNARILISQLTGADIGADGYLIRHARGRTLEELVVVGGRLDGVAGDAVRIEGGARMAVKPNYIRLDTAGVRGALVRDAAGDPGTEVIVTDRSDPIAPLPGPRR